MSRAEEITSEVRKLVLTCRAMEAQLAQSIPKKTHLEVVAKMQGQIDNLNGELDRTKSELRTTATVGDRVNLLATQVSTETESISSLSAQVSSQNQIISGLDNLVSTQKGTIESQAATLQELSSEFSKRMTALDAKLSRDTVPVLLYNQTLSKMGEIEERMRFMVERADYTAIQKRCDDLSERITTMVPTAEYSTLQKRCDELTERITTMVPTTDYIALQAQFANYVPKAQYDELQRAYTNTVPREQYTETQNRVVELETRLRETVPKSDYDELTARIASITAGVTTLEVLTPSADLSVQETPVAQVPEVVPVLEVQQVVETESSTLEAASVVENTPIEAPQREVPAEITEVQSQLSEINTQSETVITAQPVVSNSFGFNFSRTTFCAKSGMEFLDDLERVPVDVLEAHSNNGDFERWFRDVLQDEYSASSLRAIREHGSFAGEDLRTQIVAVISPKYRR